MPRGRTICNYHAQAIRHIRHLLTPVLAQQLACSLIGSRLDYCNSMLHRSQTGVFKRLQRVQDNIARIVMQANRRCDAKPLLQQLHWLLVEQRIHYKLSLITFRVRTTSTPQYLSRLLSTRVCSRTLRSSSASLLTVPRFKTELARRAFRIAAPEIWNDLPVTVQTSQTLAIFKSRLKTFLFNSAFC